MSQLLLRAIGVGLLLIAPAFAWDMAKEPWVNRVTKDFINAEQKIGIKKVDWQQTRSRVRDCWDASKLNPSWGPRELCAVRLLVSFYGESGLDPNCICRNKNKTVDVCVAQTNSCHWMPKRDSRGKYHRTEWENFCKSEHLDASDLTLLFNPRISILFGAHLNEIFIKNRQRTYNFDDRWDKKLIYEALMKDVPQEIAEK